MWRVAGLIDLLTSGADMLETVIGGRVHGQAVDRNTFA